MSGLMIALLSAAAFATLLFLALAAIAVLDFFANRRRAKRLRPGERFRERIR